METTTRGRPPVPETEQHRRAFRLRLKDDDAAFILALAKTTGIPPAVVLRSMVRRQIPAYQLLKAAGQRITIDIDE